MLTIFKFNSKLNFDFCSKGWQPKKTIETKLKISNDKNLETNDNKRIDNKNVIDNDNINTNSFYFIWASERSGYNQLYLYHYNGKKYEKGVCSGTCLLNGRPIGGGGNWIVDRYFVLSTLLFFCLLYSALLSPLLYSFLLFSAHLLYLFFICCFHLFSLFHFFSYLIFCQIYENKLFLDFSEEF